jgi:hypothetical protein
MVALAVVCAAPVGAARASERLAPEGSTGIGDYEAQVARVLKGAFASDVRLRAIFEPSFSPEFAVGLKGGAAKPAIFVLEPARQVWDYSVLEMMKSGQIAVTTFDGKPGTAEAIRRIEKDLPPKPDMLMVSRCEIAVAPALAGSIEAAWRAMLLEVQPGERLQVGLDGEFVHFSMKVDGTPRGGVIWSPGLETRPGRLVTLAWEMRNYCKGRKPESLSAMQKALDGLGAPAR